MLSVTWRAHRGRHDVVVGDAHARQLGEPHPAGHIRQFLGENRDRGVVGRQRQNTGIARAAKNPKQCGIADLRRARALELLVLGNKVPQRRRHRSKALDRIFRNLRQQLILEIQGSSSGFGEESFDKRAGGRSGSVADLVDAIDEFAFCIRAVNGRGDIERRRQNAGCLARRRYTLRKPLLNDVPAGNL